MSSDAMAIRNVQVGGQPWVQTLHEWVTTVDHKQLGILYILYALTFLVIGGVEAVIIRIQLMYPHNHFVSPQVFNRMFTMHGTTMIFFVAMPVLFGFANYLVPLMIGARDMAFPRLNAFSFWLTALGGFLLYFSFLGGNGLYGAGHALDALLLDIRTSRGVHPDYPLFCFYVGNRPGIFPKTDFRIPGHGRSHGLYRLREHECVGAPHFYNRDELLRQQLFRDHFDAGRCSDGNQDLQLAWHDVGREDPIQDTDAVLHRISVSVFDRRPHRNHACVSPF